MTVPPYAVAACMTLVVAFTSDRLKVRGIIMLCTMPIAIIGYAVIANIDGDHPKVKYGMTIMMATGIYSSVPPVLAWLANNSAGHYKRATAAALQLAIANCGGILSVFLYPDADGPDFHRGHTIILGLLVAGWFLYVFPFLPYNKAALLTPKQDLEQRSGLHQDQQGQGAGEVRPVHWLRRR